MGQIYYFKVKVVSLIIYVSVKLITSNGYIYISRKRGFPRAGICLLKNMFFGVNVTN